MGFPEGHPYGEWSMGHLGNVRTDGSYQLNGAAGTPVRAGFSGAPVWSPDELRLVGMVVAHDADSSGAVAFLIPVPTLLEFAGQAPHPGDVLTQGLARTAAGAGTSLNRFLGAYIGTPERPAPFGGRDLVLASLDAWFATDGSYGLMVAEAGRGKSAVVGQWAAAQAARGVDIALLPISVRFQTSLRRDAFSLLGARLAYLTGQPLPKRNDADEWRAIIEVALDSGRPSDRPLLVIIDGADEAADWTCGKDLSFPPTPPAGVRLMVTARPVADRDAPAWRSLLGWASPSVTLLQLPPLTTSDVEKLVANTLQPGAPAAREDLGRELARLSEGDPLILRLYLDHLNSTGISDASELAGLAPGLDGVFEQWWTFQLERRGDRAKEGERPLRQLLQLLSSALGPLRHAELLEVASGILDSEHLGEQVAALDRFVLGDGSESGYVLAHPKLAIHERERMSDVERQAWDGRFVAAGQRFATRLSGGSTAIAAEYRYFVEHHGAHLDLAEARSEAYDALLQPGWFAAWEDLTGTPGGFLEDAERVRLRGIEVQALDRVVNATLVMSSVQALLIALPPPLIEALLQRGMWTGRRALDYARRIQDERAQLDLVGAVLPYLTPEQRGEVSAAVAEFRDPATQLEAQLLLAGYLEASERRPIVEKAIERARRMAKAHERAYFLAQLHGWAEAGVRSDLEGEILDAVGQAASLEDDTAPYRTIAKRLDQEMRDRVFRLGAERLLAQSAGRHRDWEAAHLVEAASAHTLPEALGLLTTITSPSLEASALGEVLPISTGRQRAELFDRFDRLLRQVESGYDVLSAISSAAGHLDEHQAARLLDIAGNHASTWPAQGMDTLSRLAAQLPSGSPKASVVSSLLAQMPSSPAGAEWVQALTALATVIDDDGRYGVAHKAFQAAVAEPHPSNRRTAIARLVGVMDLLPPEDDLVALARVIGDEEARATLFRGLSTQAMNSGDTALVALRTAESVREPFRRIEALTGLLPRLKGGLREQATSRVVDWIRDVRYGFEFGYAVQILAKAVDSREVPWQRLWDLADDLRGRDGESGLLLALVEHDPGMMSHDPLRRAGALATETERAPLFANLLGKVNHGQRTLVWREFLASAESAPHPGYLANWLSEAWPHFTEPELEVALQLVDGLTTKTRGPPLIEAAKHVGPKYTAAVERRAAGLTGYFHKAEVYLTLAERFPGEHDRLLQTALVAAHEIDRSTLEESATIVGVREWASAPLADAAAGARTLVRIAERLTVGDRLETLEVALQRAASAHSIVDESATAGTLASFARCGFTQFAVEQCDSIEEPELRAALFAVLSDHARTSDERLHFLAKALESSVATLGYDHWGARHESLAHVLTANEPRLGDWHVLAVITGWLARQPRGDMLSYLPPLFTVMDRTMPAAAQSAIQHVDRAASWLP
jgi:hypothetical protein